MLKKAKEGKNAPEARQLLMDEGKQAGGPRSAIGVSTVQGLCSDIIFSDEKKFCPFDCGHGWWVFKAADLNPARFYDWTDKEYKAGKKER